MMKDCGVDEGHCSGDGVHGSGAFDGTLWGVDGDQPKGTKNYFEKIKRKWNNSASPCSAGFAAPSPPTIEMLASLSFPYLSDS